MTHFNLRLRPRTVAAGLVLSGAAASLIATAAMSGALATQIETARQANGFTTAAAAGFSDDAIGAAMGGLDSAARDLAHRYDPTYGLTLGAPVAGPGGANLETAGFSPILSLGLRMRPSAASGGSAAYAARDIDCLARAVYFEARGEGREGMEAVAQVILNRVRHPAFPKSVCAVVYQRAFAGSGCQFSFACSPAQGPIEPSALAQSRQIAVRALGGNLHAGIGAATHYHASWVTPPWAEHMMKVAAVGDHIFYRLPSRSERGSVPAEILALAQSAPAPTLQKASLPSPAAPQPAPVAPVAKELSGKGAAD